MPAQRPDPRLTDAVLALAMLLVVAAVMAADPAGPARTGPAGFLFAGVFGALVLLRRRAPRLMLVVTVLCVFAYYTFFDFAPVGIALPAVAALYSAAEMRRTAWAVGAGTVLVAVAAYYRVVGADPEEYLTPYDFVTNVALAAAAIALGAAVRLGREARERSAQIRELTAAQEARAAERRMQAERLGIARDLHDAVGHDLSVVALHANVAAEAIGRDDDAARAALDQVRSAASDTLHELRGTVRVLRGGSDGATGVTGLAGIGALVGPARSTGLDVVVDVDVPPGSVDAAVDAAASRIVTEALTNVLRHASARRARVAASVAGQSGDRLRIEVSDDGAGAGGAPEGSGISGMRERATLLGGTLRAGDAPGGGFAVVADLPARLDLEAR